MSKLSRIKYFFSSKFTVSPRVLPILGASILIAVLIILWQQAVSVQNINQRRQEIENQLTSTQEELEVLKNEDQYQVNQELKDKIVKTESAYKSAVSTYEMLVDFRQEGFDTSELEVNFAESLNLLSELEYEEAEKKLAEINQGMEEERQEAARGQIEEVAQETAPESQDSQETQISTNNTPPGSGYSRQVVSTDVGNFTVSIVAADIASTKVIIDTAAESDCDNNCPRYPLNFYVSRNNAYAGINGAYFCPEEYPSCAGKTNSFDLLLMNKDKYYFNSDNNVYSNNPGYIFGPGYVRVVEHVSQWGRDTSIDGMISNYPLLVFNGGLYFTGSSDPKMTVKSGRSFVANTGNAVYIGVVHSATVAESAKVLHTMGVENAMNLDSGGSTALWHGGYKAGPGRDLTNVILFLNR